MVPLQKIQDFLEQFKELTPADLAGFFALVVERKLIAGEIWISEGEVSKKLAYIQYGLVRASCIKENGDEVTTLLRWEDQFVASHHNLILNKPSSFIYQSIEDTLLWELDFQKAQELINSNPALASVRNHFMLNMLAESMARTENLILLSPEERYLRFVRDKPGIIDRVPNKYIATLLGITPVSLSRIRRRIALKSQNKR